MSKIALIGSTALQYYTNIGRQPSDIDLLMLPEDFDDMCSKLQKNYPVKSITYLKKWKDCTTGVVVIAADHPEDRDYIIECELVTKPHQQILLDSILCSSKHICSPFSFLQCGVATVSHLYHLKLSHKYLRNSPHFRKTMADLQFMRDNFSMEELTDCPVTGWYNERVADTYWYNHPSLKATRDEFFKDDVPYQYDHDDIHKAVAIESVPAYTLYMKNGAEVECDKDKFFSLTHQQRLNGVYEEACVLALERHQIPNSFQPDPYKSFQIALEKVCTSITSGWFREFAWDHYHEVLAMYNEDWLLSFHEYLAHGKIKPFHRVAPQNIPQHPRRCCRASQARGDCCKDCNGLGWPLAIGCIKFHTLV